MDKLKMHSPDLTKQNIARIAELFPSCVTESRMEDGLLKHSIDFDMLRQELSESIVEGPHERYHLSWPGKRGALLAANSPIAKTLRPNRDESINFDTTRNLFVEGDNLDALKLLQETLLSKVKLIYIDPPYNTGQEFIYDDDFAIDAETYLSRSFQKDENGNRLIPNLESNGRFHSDWLSMIYPRLKLARNLLKDDGFIIVSIDDVEVENMKSLLNEVFGKENELAILVWDKNRKNDARFFSVGHEYMCVYAKSKQVLVDSKIVLREPKQGLEEAKLLYEKLRSKYPGNTERQQIEWRAYFSGLKDSDERKKLGRFAKIGERGPFRDDGDISWPGGGGPKYQVLHPITNKPCKVPNGGWVYPSKDRFDAAVRDGRVVFGPDETTLPRQARYLFEGEGQVMPSVFYSYAQTATLEFVELMQSRVFENPKNWRDMKRVVSYLSKEDDIVMDFFAGSCSTAHGVIAANHEDGGTRRFVMIQINEKCADESVALKSGYQTIVDIGLERIKRAGEEVRNHSPIFSHSLDCGVRLLTVDTSNMKDVYYQPNATKQSDLFSLVDNIKEDRTSEDLLFQVLLDWGVDLSLPIACETIGGHEVFFVDGNALAACFDKDLSEETIKGIASRKPIRAVFRDASFSNDSAKINIEQVFKYHSPSTELRCI